MYASFDFTNNTITSSIVVSGFIRSEVLHNNLQASDGSLSFSIPFSTAFCNALSANINSDILTTVYNEDNTIYARGYIKKEVAYNQQYRNKPIKLTIVSPSYMLDKTLDTSYALEGRTSGYIVNWLLTQAGFTSVGDLSSMADVVPLFMTEAGENIKTVLKEFCFEYGKTFYFDNEAVFQVTDLFVAFDSASQTFTRDNIRGEIQIVAKESEADCIRGKWSPVDYVEDTLVFEDNQGRTDSQDCSIEIAANSYFGGMQDNFLTCDSTLGAVKMVRTITQNNITAQSGINITLDLDGRNKLDQIHFTAQNTTSSEKYITKMQVYADAYICKETREDVTTYGAKEKELELKYVQNETVAQNLIKALADYYHSTNFTVNFSSTIDCAIGALVTVQADGIGTYNCRVIRKTRQLSKETIDYVCENIGSYTPAEIVDSRQTPLATNTATGTRGLDGGYQDYQFAVGDFDLTDEQARALTWYDAPPPVPDGKCLYMATKFIGNR